jgi:hypothetical protein
MAHLLVGVHITLNCAVIKGIGMMIGIGVVLLLALAYFVTEYFYWSRNWEKVVSLCTDYDPKWEGMTDCYGVISIWQPWNGSGYTIQNNTDPGPVIAQIASRNAFIVQGNYMYLVDTTRAGKCPNNEPGYCRDFQVNGTSKIYHYDNPNQVPKYLIINTQSGDEQFYVQPQDASSNAALAFQELKKGL